MRIIARLILWIVRRIRREQEQQQKQAEEIIQLKKRQNEDAAHDEWKEKLDQAYRECSSYGKSRKTGYKRNYRRKSAH